MGESPVSNGEAHRWKAPRVQRNASLFAERRGKRPWRRWWTRKRPSSQAGSRARQEISGSLVSPTLNRRNTLWAPAVRQVISGCSARLAQAGSPGELDMGTRQHVCARQCWPLQLALQRASRRQVSGPIGSGRSSRCEQSRREASGTAKASRPLTRETSAGSLGGAAGERAQARELGATRERATRIRCSDEGRPSWLGSCFGKVSVAEDRSRLPTSLPNVHALTGGRGKGRGAIGRGSGDSIGRARGSC